MSERLIAFVTCKELPEPDSDEELVQAACDAAGIHVELAPWDDPSIDWSRYAAAVLRSTWNYYEEPDSFLEWLGVVESATVLWNSAKIVRKNLNKSYLGTLSSRGVPIVPTRFLSESHDLTVALKETGWDDFVLKPTISAASFMTRRFTGGQQQEALQFAKEFGDRKILLQKFMHKVEDAGEIALVHISGELTHAVHKHPRFHGDEEQTSEAVVPNSAQRKVAQKALATIKEPWLYARVDLMESDEGEWLLSELEMIEPSLFLREYPPALERFVSSLKALTEKNP